MLTVREESRQKFAVSFQDEQFKPFLPATIRYRLDDRTDGRKQQVIDWTDVTPTATSIEILIPSTANIILNDNNAYETRVLTIQSDYGTDNQLSFDETYRVLNLRGFQ